MQNIQNKFINELLILYSEKILAPAYCVLCDFSFEPTFDDIVIYGSKKDLDYCVCVHYKDRYYHSYAICPICGRKIEFSIGCTPYEMLIDYKLNKF